MLNELSIKHQSYLQARKLDAFEQKTTCMSLNISHKCIFGRKSKITEAIKNFTLRDTRLLQEPLNKAHMRNNTSTKKRGKSVFG